ncbi:hypothetical protein FPF71_15115 [Algibacter amylolyticus]|uniref:Uncharacterized protein n=1 Tax=Algibacter amylolyticus TaxID=1608400 RepID=A0A5M7AZ62_9FLAO|nr:hypothetical protein [Algibacter amylolyticus]KAA5822472.1 hypothetical protein F2B50_15115 [Algibacter amylolyticus]MBB5269197.1 hypothetical protein [Algibacter amylolyticus]TSJ73622.1 hypothetical protein FPF71_15115 [Algibacter amylolyticus]
MKRTENLPEILHLRAAPIGYELTENDKELLLDTYQKLDDILKEVAAFVNVKFPGRQDYIQPWNDIDFDTKIGGIKIATTDREHTKSAWKKGIFDLKSLIKSLINEVTLLVDQENEIKGNPLLDEKEWDKYYDERLEKRADQADFFLDMIIEKGLINLDKSTVRKYFKKWFNQSQDFDLQIKDGDFAIENGDIQTVPDFSKDNIPEFLKWFEDEGNNFMDYLKEQGVNVKKGSKETIINNGNMIINKKSKTGKQTIKTGTEQEESNWSKANTIIALVVGIASIIGIAWQIWG